MGELAASSRGPLRSLRGNTRATDPLIQVDRDVLSAVSKVVISGDFLLLTICRPPRARRAPPDINGGDPPSDPYKADDLLSSGRWYFG